MLLLSQRQSTQLQELEIMKASILGLKSFRSRNPSNERSQTYQRSLKFSIDNQRQKNNGQSYSGEKQLNLSSQNQKVENLIATWTHQKNSQSLHSSSNIVITGKLITDVRQVAQLDDQNKESIKPHIIIEEDAVFTEERENQPFIQNNKHKQVKTPVHLIAPNKSYKEQCIKFVNEETQEMRKWNGVKKLQNQNYQRPQTTKANPGNQAKSSPLVFKEQSLQNPMKISFIDQTKLNKQQSGPNNNKNVLYSSKIVKKNNIGVPEEIQQDNQFIPELERLKEQILSTYLKQNRALIGSQNQILKNFDQILYILKQDFQK
ncbi:unnamed protein product (macronuclear) [Paramecium tetraurelia]|uniref:Uncharacterized protein n=1 Tax=Paramecium tetraurelia TaxID=5888 RepID=A0ECC7_PARTE|nr:uncharacterized protein GSPATT00025681001 [Paramecium tetraurelia]CAK92944.1 unnamed protein product [Paramecium tetraurelia]|eukprot:XP_001460341.1 hypothetical protein (macronuclear) [Paramecium tetraurelia strain d4-2]